MYGNQFGLEELFFQGVLNGKYFWCDVVVVFGVCFVFVWIEKDVLEVDVFVFCNGFGLVFCFYWFYFGCIYVLGMWIKFIVCEWYGVIDFFFCQEV